MTSSSVGAPNGSSHPATHQGPDRRARTGPRHTVTTPPLDLYGVTGANETSHPIQKTAESLDTAMMTESSSIQIRTTVPSPYKGRFLCIVLQHGTHGNIQLVTYEDRLPSQQLIHLGPDF